MAEGRLQRKRAARRERRKVNKKRTKQLLREAASARARHAQQGDSSESDVQVEVVPAPSEIDTGVDSGDPAYRNLLPAMQRFKLATNEQPEGNAKEEPSDQSPPQAGGSGSSHQQELADDDASGDLDATHVSRRQMKRMYRPRIADLKTFSSHPEVVEVWDAASPDPPLLVHLKAHRNTVPVPTHWSAKRRYLQGKRGIEKPPFKLPDFIEATGIQKLRDTQNEGENDKSLRQQQRERVRPKAGRIDIDYQVLHDAFFKHQTKPKLSRMGDLYYEGKEFEVDLSDKKPGRLSSELKQALGMQDDFSPPPYLPNMQRYGPPPSYPGLRIPGLNAPIPEGASYGHHPGGWGRPPVDEHGQPVYGDPFGQQHVGLTDRMTRFDTPPNPGKLWGEDVVEAESEDEDEGEDEGEFEEEPEDDERTAPSEDVFGVPSERELREGISSVGSTPSGVSTPQEVQLRKDQHGGEEPMAQMPTQPQQLYRVLEERESDGTSKEGLMGSTHTYNVGNDDSKPQQSKRSTRQQQGQGDVAISLQPEELENGVQEQQVASKYENERQVQKEQNQGEDLSDMVAEHEAKQKRKRGESQGTHQQGEKRKRFKF
jgi:splicing factor 3B subunit 2